MAAVDPLQGALKAFMGADDLIPVVGAFEQVLTIAVPDWHALPSYERFPRLLTAASTSAPFVVQRLFQVLDLRWRAAQGMRGQVCNADGPSDVAVSGAGPCGLRAAVELAILGFSATVIERRAEFSRHNILKTWSNTVDDLVALGFKNYFPSFQPHGRHSVGTREIQSCLLKTALIFGVEFVYGEAVTALAPPSLNLAGGLQGRWRVITDKSGRSTRLIKPNERSSQQDTNEIAELSVQPGEQDVSRLVKTSKVDFYEAAASQDGAIATEAEAATLSAERAIPFNDLVIAEGESSLLVRHLGFDRLVTRYNQAIGIIVNVKFDPQSSLEKKLPEFVYSRSMADWRSTPIGPLADQGIVVENIEYLRFSTHFVVVTILRDSLVNCGVLIEPRATVKESLAADNIDVEKLRHIGRSLATAAGVPPTAPFADKHSVNIFDFSCKGKLIKLSRLLEDEGTDAAPVLVAPVGDTLLNPFWPQGLGVNRGFHSALDAVWAIFRRRTVGLEDSREEHEAGWRILLWLPLVPAIILPGAGWTADPLTRYAPQILKSIYNQAISTHKEVPLPSRMLATIISSPLLK